jgi:hypothetical protein
VKPQVLHYAALGRKTLPEGVGGGKRTADPSASPDFLLILLALTDFMRFSPTENRMKFANATKLDRKSEVA